MFTQRDIDDAICLGIIHCVIPPELTAYNEGYAAHADAKCFHECPYDQITSAALSWRIGWNDRALAQR